MTTNLRVDVIIVGDSKEGQEALKKIAANPTIKIAFISREFKKTTTRDYLTTEYINDEVIFTDYNNRLFCCYLKTGKRIYGTHLIIASGLSYDPLLLENKPVPCVFNTPDDITKAAKNQQAIVVGSQDSDIKLAISVAKKFKYVYLCIKEISLSEKQSSKLADIKNIVVLPNTSISRVYAPNDVLQTVELDNYSKITCSAIFAKTKTHPETTFVSAKIISKNEEGYFKVSNISQSILVPKCFAVGNCVEKSTQKMQQAMVESIIKDFVEER